eukprot:TRINITY_DN101069_c0_g1_i1.p1 TRINITY_DN101069_c0_g1~~TRINITY_DN101069_c0_g1_i1.p1  ORF type:complete len:225 (+),score=43.17 TRINITY_DN101069_c0_g1_i1:87-761(+)
MRARPEVLQRAWSSPSGLQNVGPQTPLSPTQLAFRRHANPDHHDTPHELRATLFFFINYFIWAYCLQLITQLAVLGLKWFGPALDKSQLVAVETLDMFLIMFFALEVLLEVVKSGSLLSYLGEPVDFADMLICIFSITMAWLDILCGNYEPLEFIPRLILKDQLDIETHSAGMKLEVLRDILRIGRFLLIATRLREVMDRLRVIKKEDDEEYAAEHDHEHYFKI